MTEEEKTSTLAQPEFLDFVEHSTKIIQRALNDHYDYVRDYTIGTESGPYVMLIQSPLGVLKCDDTVMIQRDDASNASARFMTNVQGRTDPLLA